MTGAFVARRAISQATSTLDVDAVVVGTGAGGSVALRELARAGLNAVGARGGRVVHVRATSTSARSTCSRSSSRTWAGARPRTWPSASSRAAASAGAPSTTRTSASARRTRSSISGRASTASSGARRRPTCGPRFEAIERDLSVSRDPGRAAQPQQRRAPARAARRSAGRAGRSRTTASAASRAASASSAARTTPSRTRSRSIVPQALAAGARVYADVQAVRIVARGSRVTGVDGGGARPRTASRAGAVRVRRDASWCSRRAPSGSAALARRERPARSPRPARARPAHAPRGRSSPARFDRAIEGWRGIPQSYECTEHLSFERGERPARLDRPRLRPPHRRRRRAARLRRGAHGRHARVPATSPCSPRWCTTRPAARSPSSDDGRPVIRYAMSDARPRAARQGPRRLRAPAARRRRARGDHPGHPPAPRAPRIAELDALDLSFVRPHSVPLTAVHPMGTMRMGEDPERSVVASDRRAPPGDAASSSPTARSFRRASGGRRKSASTRSRFTSRLTWWRGRGAERRALTGSSQPQGRNAGEGSQREGRGRKTNPPACVHRLRLAPLAVPASQKEKARQARAHLASRRYAWVRAVSRRRRRRRRGRARGRRAWRCRPPWGPQSRCPRSRGQSRCRCSSRPAALDTLPEPSMMMSDACSICCAMLWNALPEQRDTEMWPATLWRLLTSSVVMSVPAMVPLVTEPGDFGSNVTSAEWTLMVSDWPPIDSVRFSSHSNVDKAPLQLAG